MLVLPRHHVPRPRLRERVGEAPIVVIEAPSGYGKSTFAAELTAARRTIEVALGALDTGRAGFLRTLRRALLRAGERAAAVTIDDSVDDDGLLAALDEAMAHSEPLTLVIDDAHHLRDDSTVLLSFVRQRPRLMSLIITARVLPRSARSIVMLPGVEYVEGDDLRFGVEEARALLEGRAVVLDDVELEELVEHTSGWPAGIALAAAQLARTERSELIQGNLRRRFADVVIAASPAFLRADIVQLAHLPMIDRSVARAVTGRDDALDELLSVGLPLARDDAGAIRFPGALADALQEHAPLERAVARRVAEEHLAMGRPALAIDVLRLTADEEALADLLLDMPPAARRRLSADETIATIDSLSPDIAARHPMLLIELARAAARAGIPGAQQVAVDRAVATGRSEPALRHAIEAERMTYELYTRYITDREAQSRRVRDLIDECSAGEERTLGRALAVHGQQLAWDGRRGEADLTLRRAARVLSEAGDDFAASGALVQLGFNVHLHEQLAVAEETFAEAVRLAADDGRARATALTYLGEVKIWRGRSAEGVLDLEEAELLARATRDARAHAYAAWGLALHASIHRDHELTVARVEQAGRLLREWMDSGVGATYLATMTDTLDRAGATDQADRMLALAQQRREEAPELVTLAEFGIAARRGDPKHAEALWTDIEADQGIEPFERVRCRLLRAYAALRRDDREVTQRYRELIADSDALGMDGVPWHLEPTAAEAVQQWWSRHRTRLHVRLLGPLCVTRDGRILELPAGKPTELVLLLAVSRAPVATETVLDALWGAPADAGGLARLRQTLYRLRQAVPDLVVRSDTHLSFEADVTVDLDDFEQSAARVHADPDDRESATHAVRLVDPAFFTMAMATGVSELFERIRMRVRAQLVQMHEALARLSTGAQVLENLRRAHALDPGDDLRAARFVEALMRAERHSEAVYVLDSTIQSIKELGLEVPDGLHALGRQVRQPR